MIKSNILIAFLIIFILPVFIGSYNKYQNYEYSEMNYNEIGREYTEYFTEGVEEISVIGEIGEVSIKVMDYITDAIDWIMDAFDSVICFFKDFLNIKDTDNLPGKQPDDKPGSHFK